MSSIRKLVILSAFFTSLTFQLMGACGSGITGKLVPDAPLFFNFTTYCERHDECYDTCGKTRGHCDRTFRSEMKNRCRDRFNKWDPRRKICEETAFTYHSAVHRMGGDAYRAAQKDRGC